MNAFRFSKLSLLLVISGSMGAGFAQISPNQYDDCSHEALLFALRNLEDQIALASASPVVRKDYSLNTTDAGVTGKVYMLYRCEALSDSIVALEARLAALTGGSTPPPPPPSSLPTVDTEAASLVTDADATLNATFTDGGSAVTVTGFKYGTDAALSSPTDVVGNGTSSPFMAALTGLAASTQYWAVGYATNGVGTSYGDTITFTTSPVVPETFTCGTSTVTYDGHSYPTVQIGTQCWFAENLRNDNYADGTVIPGGLSNSAWLNATDGAFSIYQEGGANEATNLATYGRLYNWFAVSDARGICPTGWHVPTDAEWATLETQLGGAAVAGTAMKSSPSDSPAWEGNNSSGFGGLPSGGRFGDGSFALQGYYGYWWSSSFIDWNTLGRFLRSGYSNLGRWSYYPYPYPTGISVRCVQDLPPVAPTVDTDDANLIGETTATLNATFTDGGAVTTVTGFKFGTDIALSNPTDVAGSATTSPFTAALTGLTAGTQYWAVGYVTNGVGTSYGDTITFTTLAATGFTCGISSVTYDGYSYSTVQIGTQCWFAENLRNDNYADGTVIPGGLNNSAWLNASGAFSIYDEGGTNEATNLATYGRLYNWHAVTNAAGLCPTGWHVPTDAEWTTLETELGGASVAGSKMKATTPAWDGTNSSGFNGLPAGNRFILGSFYEVGDNGYWWSSSPNGGVAIFRNLGSGYSYVQRGNSHPRTGFSVRCVRN
jgi:uncharacterized protein (TIGR02145 family)